MSRQKRVYERWVAEMLYRARNDRATFDASFERLSATHRYLIPDRDICSIATDAYVELAHGGPLGGKSLTDILVASTATRHQIPVLHVDSDFELLSSLDCMAFEPRRLVPPGTQV